MGPHLERRQKKVTQWISFEHMFAGRRQKSQTLFTSSIMDRQNNMIELIIDLGTIGGDQGNNYSV